MIILDTHTWIWWVNESDQLSPEALQSIQDAPNLGVSAISCWEVAMLVSKQRIGFGMDIMDWVEGALKRPKIQLIPLSPKILVTSTRLPGEFHGDPADRFIVSTCLSTQSSLVSKDKRIHKWNQIKVIW